jgi:hypothetical protein
LRFHTRLAVVVDEIARHPCGRCIRLLFCLVIGCGSEY